MSPGQLLKAERDEALGLRADMAPHLRGHEDVARVHEGQVVGGVRDPFGGLERRGAEQ